MALKELSWRNLRQQFKTALFMITDKREGVPVIKAMHINTTKSVLDKILDSRFIDENTKGFVEVIKMFMFGKVSEHGGMRGIKDLIANVEVLWNKKLVMNSILLVEQSAYTSEDFTVEVGTTDEEHDHADAVVRVNGTEIASDKNVISLFGGDGDKNKQLN